MRPPVLDRLRTTYREMGFLKSLLYLADRVLRKLNPRCGICLYQFVAQPLAEKPRLPPSRGKSYTFQLLSGPEPVLNALGRPPGVIAQRFAQGSQCLVALRDQSLVGCIWFVSEHYAEDEVRADYWLPLEGGCVWDFDVFITEHERLGFLFPKLWDTFDAHLKTRNVAWTLSRINGFNQRSLASHRNLGAADCGWALFMRLGALEMLASSLRPYAHAGLWKRPVFRLTPPVKRTEV